MTLYVRDKGDRTEVDNPGYVISVDKKSGQLSKIVYKYFRTGFLMPIDLSPETLVQPGFSIQIEGKEGAEWLTASSTIPKSVRTEEGGVYFRHISNRKLVHPSIDGTVDIFTEMLFPGSMPYVHIREKICFEKDTPVYNMKLAGHRFPEGIYSHFTFRPVTAVSYTHLDVYKRQLLGERPVTSLN